jgi:hypothetical protein
MKQMRCQIPISGGAQAPRGPKLMRVPQSLGQDSEDAVRTREVLEAA